MRKLPLHDINAVNGASFGERYGVEVVTTVSDLKKEYQTIRDTVGVTDFSFMQKFRVSGDNGVDLLDKLFAGNVAKIRFCRVLHTFLADEKGDLVADVYIANNDDDFIVLCESIIDDAAIKELFTKNGVSVGGENGLEDITDSHVVISIDGYHACKVVKELFGADVIGLPYLSVETYPFEDNSVLLFRSGKTCEFGYLLMAPKEAGPKLMDTVLAEAQKHEGGLCGVEIHNELRLEGRFFNIFAEGARVKDPLSLGLQWMIDFDKDSFLGSGPIMERREQGLKHKIVGVKVDSSAVDFKVNDPIFCEGYQVACLQATCFSHVLNAHVGLALLPFDMAYVGLQFKLQKPDGPEVQTISMPPIMPKSLSANPNEL